MPQHCWHGGRKNLAISSEFAQANYFENGKKFVPRTMIVSGPEAWLYIQAAELLFKAGRPVTVDDYEVLTGVKQNLPEGKIKLYVDIAEKQHRLELDRIIDAGKRMNNQLYDDKVRWRADVASTMVAY